MIDDPRDYEDPIESILDIIEPKLDKDIDDIIKKFTNKFQCTNYEHNNPTEDDVTYRYKQPKKIYCLIGLNRDEDRVEDGGLVVGKISGDLFTLTDELKRVRLPLDESEYINGYVQYTERGVTVKKQIKNVVFNARWGTDPLVVEIFFEKEVVHDT